MPKGKTHFNKSNETKIKLPTSSMGAWLTNVGKSVGYSARDIFTEMMPATMEYASSGAEMVREFRDKMVNYRIRENGLSNAIEKSVYNEIARDAIANAKDAIRTGKFYDPDKEVYDDGFGDFDFGDDFDFDMDVSDGFGEGSGMSEDSDGEPTVTNVKVAMNIGEDSPMVQSINNQTKVAIEASEQQIGVMKSNHTMFMSSFNQFDKNLSGHFGALNENVGKLTTVVSTTLTQHASLSAKYYNDSMTVFNSINEKLESIHGLMQPQAVLPGKEYTDILDIFNANGTLNFGAYKEVLKKQTKTAIESNMILSQIVGAVSDEDSWRYLAQNPLKFIPEKIIKTVIGSSVEQSIRAFDETLSQTMIAGLHRIKGLSHSDNPILQFIGSAFGIDNRLKTNVDKANYVRGKVDWDGESRKTLVEVIPYYLRKMTAALTGEREMAFDYNAGVFRTIHDMYEERTRDRERMFTSNFSDITSGFRDFLANRVGLESKQDERDARDMMDKFITRMVSTSGNRLSLNAQNSFIDSVAEILGTSANDDYTKLIAGYLDGQRSSTVMGLSSKILEQRASISKKMQDIEEGRASSNEMYFNNGTKFDQAYDKHGNVDYSKTSLGGGLDKYGRTSVSYLRDILELMSTGVKVWVVGNDVSYSGKTKGKRKQSSAQVSPIMTKSAKIYDKLSQDVTNSDKKKADDNQHERGDYSDEQLKAMEEKGYLMHGDYGYNVNSVGWAAKYYREEKEAADLLANQDKTMDWFMRITDLGSEAPLVKMLNKVIRTAHTKPGEITKNFFGKADDFLFRLVFGGSKTEGGSLVKSAMATLQGYFKKFAGNFNNLISKMQDAIFNEKTGLIAQIKNSKFGVEFKAYGDKLKNYLFGSKDADGNYQGGLFSDTATELKTIASGFKESMIGKNEDSVLSHVKSAVTSKFNNVTEFLGFKVDNAGKDKSKTPIQDTMDSVYTEVKVRASSFMDDTFGKDTERRKTFDQVQSDLTGKRGKMGAGATLGILGSFFLPGGPIIGAMMGLGATAVKESETLKHMMFGSKDAATGEEKAGLINKDLVNLYNDNKTGIKLGLAAGAVAKFGLLPSFLAPGGPIGAAFLGLGASIAYNSDVFQDFMYGPKGADGERLGNGFADKMKFTFGEFDKGRFIDAGVGAGIGFLGGMFTPLGPAGGAIIGSAIGLASSTERFKRFLFGDYVDSEDPSKGRNNKGIIGKAYSKIIEPLATEFKVAQVRLYGWFERNIANTLTVAMSPITTEIKYLKDRVVESISNMFSSVGGYIKDKVIDPIGDTVNKFVVKPITKFASLVLRGFTTIIRGAVAAPFAAIGAIASGLNRKQMKRGKNKWVDDTLGTTITGRDSEGNKVGWMGRLRAFGQYAIGNRESREAAKFGENGASYGYVYKDEKKQLDDVSTLHQRYNEEAARNGGKLLSKKEFLDMMKSKNETPQNAAFGKRITKLGEYVLSPGETVIPNPSKEQQMSDYVREKAYIASKYGNPNAREGFAFGTMLPKTSEYVQQLKDKKAADKAARIARKEKEDAELKATQHKGSFANRMAEWKLENQTLEQDKRMSNIEKNLEALVGVSKTYVSDWGKVWNKKSGIITLLLMTAGPVVVKLVENIAGFASNILNGVNDFNNLFQNGWNHIKTAFDQIGGLAGIIPHAAENFKYAAETIKELFDPTSDRSIPERVQNFLTPYNEETGQYEVDAYTNQKTLGAARMVATAAHATTKRYTIDMAEDGTIAGISEINKGKIAGVKGNKILQKTGEIAGHAIDDGVAAVQSYTKFNTDIIKGIHRTGVNISDEVGKMIAKLPKVYTNSIKSVYDSLYNVFIKTPKEFAKGVSDIIKVPATAITEVAAGVSDDGTKIAYNHLKMKGSLYASRIKESKIAKPFIKTGEFIGNVVDDGAELAKTGKNAIYSGMDDVAESTSKGITKVGKTVSGGIKRVGHGIESAPGKVKKFLVGDAVQEGAEASAKKVGGLIGGLIDAISGSKAFAHISGFKTKFASGFGKIFSAVGGLDKFIQKYSSKIIAAMAKVAPGKLGRAIASVGTLGLVDVAFAGFGLIDGATSASNLFQVDEEYVDSNMRTISAVFRALMNTTPGMLIDIINQIMTTTVGINFVRSLAILIYELISTSAQVENLNTGITEFNNKYNAYVKEEYDKFMASEEGKAALAEGKYSGNWEADADAFKASAKADTMAEFNNREHQTLTTKIATKVSGFVKDVGSNKSTANVFNKDYWVIPEGLSEEDAIATRTKQLLMSPVYLVGNVVTGVGNTIKDLLSGVMDAGKGMITAVGQTFTKVKGIGDVFSSTYWDDGVELSPGDMASSFQSIGNVATKFMMFGPAMVYGLGQTVWNGLKTVVNKIAGASAKVSQASDFSLMSINGIGDVFNSSYWQAPPDDAGNPMSALNRASFYGMRAITFIPAAAIGVAKSIGKVISPIVDPIKKSFLSWSGFDLDSKSGAPVDEKGNPLSGVAVAAYYGAKALQIPVKLITWVGESVGKIIGPIAKTAGSVLGAMFTDITTAVEVVDDPFAVFKSSYWAMNNTDYDQSSMGSLRKVGFYASRVLLAPFMAPLGLIKQTFKLIGDIVGHPKDFGNLFNKEELYKLKPDEYWKNPSKEKGDDLFTGLSGIVFSISRTLMAPFYYIRRAINSVSEAIADSPKWFKDLFGFGSEVEVPKNGGVATSKTTTPYNNNYVNPGVSVNTSNKNTPASNYLGNGGNGEMVNGFPYYSQNDPSIKNNRYAFSGSGGLSKLETMGNRGCGPTALAMVSDALKGGNGDLPTELANVATNQGFSTTAGTTPSYFTKVGSQLGMDVTETTANEANIRYMLNSGKPVIIQGQSSDKNSPYTSSGHYVVAVGMDKNGNVLINDPRGKRYSKAYSMDAVTNGSYMAWGFSPGNTTRGGAVDSRGMVNAFGGNKYIIFGGNGPSAQAQELVNHALNYVGYLEKRSGANLKDKKANSGKGNFNRFAEIYNKYMGTSFSSAAWCAIFVSVMFVETFGPAAAKNLLCGNLFSLCSTGMENFRRKGQLFTSDPQVGDIVFFNFDGGKTPKHVGIVVSSDANNVYTVEGNTTEPGNESVEGVFQKARSKKHVVGYGRPAYDGATVISTSDTTASTDAFSLTSALGEFAKFYTDPIKAALYGVDDSSSNTGGASDTTTSLAGSSNAEKAWNFLKGKGFSDAAAAAILGNMDSESGINPMNVQNSYEYKVGTDDEYTTKVNSGSYTKFANDNVGYGIVQWTYPSRKQGLLDYAKSEGTSIGDLGMQLNYMYKEAENGNYQTAMNNMTVAQASNHWMLNYEKPLNQTKAAQDKRAQISQEYYNQFAGNGELGTSYARSLSRQLSGNGNNYRTNIHRYNDVNIGGNGNEMTNDEIVSLLSAMLVEMKGTNVGINKFNDKEIKVVNTPITVQDNSSRNVVHAPTTKEAIPNNTSFITPDNYALARQIASGNINWG